MALKLLVCTVGLPRSGKSTWAREQIAPGQVSFNCPIVNKDSIRLALHGQRYAQEAEPMVQAIAKIMVDALFRVGHDTVILDECNVTKKRRDAWKSDKWLTRFKVFNTPKEDCVARAVLGDGSIDHEIIPVILRMASEWEPLGKDEVET